MTPRKLRLQKRTVDQVISFANALREKSDEFFPRSNGPKRLTNEDDGKLEAFFATREFTTFRDFLAALPFDEMRELQALMYLGRGDFRIEVFWTECEAIPMHKDPLIEARHVMEKAPLIEYLSDGFEKLNKYRLV